MFDRVHGTIFKLYMKCKCIQTLYQVHMHAVGRHHITCTYQMQAALHKGFLVFALDEAERLVAYINRCPDCYVSLWLLYI